MKKEEGITLIALVITIIVLLILAGVTISTLTGDNSLLTKAEDARNTNIEAGICEQIKLAYMECKTEKLSNSNVNEVELLESVLKEKLNDNNLTVNIKNEKIIVKVNSIDYEYDILTGIAEKKKPRLGDLVTKDNYGDYIDLGQNVVKTTETTDDWRILYNDTTNDVVYAILADYLPNTNIISTISGQDLIDKLNNTTTWQNLIPEILRSKCQVKGATTAEIIIASYNEKYGTNLNYTSNPYLRTNPNDNSSSVDTLYMPHPGDSSKYGGFWLSTLVNSNFVRIVRYDGGYLYFTGREATWVGLCPVVTLPSDIQVNKTTLDSKIIWTVVK